MSGIPESHRDLLEKRAFAFLATVSTDGSPQVTPVWIDYDGTYVCFNTARGRLKDRNLRRHPVVALAILDPDNPYRYMQIKGNVSEITEVGANEHIDRLAGKYLGQDRYHLKQPGEVRVTYKVMPERVQTMG